MWVNTRVVIDIASGLVEEKTGFEYFGPIAGCTAASTNQMDFGRNLPGWMANLQAGDARNRRNALNRYLMNTFVPDVGGAPENITLDKWFCELFRPMRGRSEVIGY